MDTPPKTARIPRATIQRLATYIQVLEIKQAACPRHLRSMLRERQHLKSFCRRCRRHLCDRAVSMSARQSMGMCICNKFHDLKILLYLFLFSPDRILRS